LWHLRGFRRVTAPGGVGVGRFGPLPVKQFRKPVPRLARNVDTALVLLLDRFILGVFFVFKLTLKGFKSTYKKKVPITLKIKDL
jgi:hypothetical protein